MSRRLGLLLAAAAALCAVVASSASASRWMQVGLVEEAALFDNPAEIYPKLAAARPQVIRVSLYWGGPAGVARRKPLRPTDPADAAYDWDLYDRTVHYAAQYGMKVLLTIYGTPGWANGGKGLKRAPTRAADLRSFAFAAAKRYSGTYPGEDGRALPAVRMWLAWNEPNLPLGLQPQYRRVGRRYVIQSAIDYARICEAVYTGVHATLLRNEKVGCGVTAPAGNNRPRSARPTVSPLVFMRALKKAGLRRFDVYAHHPYYRRRTETPTTPPAKTSVTLANIDVLIRELTRLWGRKRLWITEYGYQTNPPDRTLGVSYARQAAYLKQAFAIGRRNPRIDMMLWFLLRDEAKLGAWQSGLLTRRGVRKPAFYAFRNLPRP